MLSAQMGNWTGKGENLTKCNSEEQNISPFPLLGESQISSLTNEIKSLFKTVLKIGYFVLQKIIGKIFTFLRACSAREFHVLVTKSSGQEVDHRQ